MAHTKDMTEAVMQVSIEATKIVVQVLAVAGAEEGAGPRSKPVSAGSKLGVPTLKQPTFDWNVTDTFTQLTDLSLEVNKMFQIYKINYTDKLAIIKNWLGREGLYPVRARSMQN